MKNALTLILSVALFNNCIAQCDTIVLPVIFKDVKVRMETSRIAKVTWSAEENDNNDRYEVERSYDGKYFQEVATVNPRHSYEYEVSVEINQDAYFRIKQFDKNGHFYLSKTVPIKKQFDSDLSAVFLPSQLIIRIETKRNSAYEFDLIDINGNQLSSKFDTLYKGNNTISLNSSVPNGIYFLKVYEERRLTKTLKIRK